MTTQSNRVSASTLINDDHISNAAAPDPKTYANRWRAMIFIAISLLVVSIDNTILNVALVSISTALNASAGELQWIIDSYVLVFASLLLTMGSFSDRIGRKRALQIGLGLFLIGSIACALSQTTTQLILARGFTGIGGSMIFPATLSIISATFPASERPRAFGLWAAVFGLGVGLGPLTGGLLLRFFAWESVFLVNIPVVIVALIGGYFFISESRDDDAPKVDIPGVILSILGLFALVYGIITAGEVGWTSPQVLTSFVAAIVLIAAFVLWEIRSPNAMLPMRFFRNASFTVPNLVLVLMTFSLFGLSFFLSQYFQSVLGFEPLVAGLATLPVAIILVIGGVNSARIAARFGTKRTIAVGALLVSAAMAYYALLLTPTTPYWQIFFGQITFASGIALMVSPATNSVMQSIPVRKAGIGSAMNDMTRQLGGALGIAVLGSILNGVYRSALAPIVEALPVAVPEEGREAILRSIQGANVVASRVPEAFQPLIQPVLAEANIAFVEGVRQAMAIGAVVVFMAFVLTLIALPRVIQRFEE